MIKIICRVHVHKWKRVVNAFHLPNSNCDTILLPVIAICQGQDQGRQLSNLRGGVLRGMAVERQGKGSLYYTLRGQHNLHNTTTSSTLNGRQTFFDRF
jgi:hypothetical protein